MKNRFQFSSLTKAGGRAKFTMMQPFGGAPLSLDEALREDIFAQIRLAAETPGRQTETASFGAGVASQFYAQPAPVEFDTVEELLPKESDYLVKEYRAISATMAPCYGLDFSKPGVLEASVKMLDRQTVYKDHRFYSVDNWVGVVGETRWDGADEAGAGVPGINAKLKLDSKKDPMLVRGVAMEPPAVHSTSVTVAFEFDYSHPRLVEEGKFWSMLGEEVDGQVVRLIVMKILGYWELSLVFQGAQYENKQLPASGPQAEMMSAAPRPTTLPAGTPAATTKETTTVKVSNERKAALGITHEGEDVPDEVVLTAAESLAAQAAAGQALLTARRAECLRVAKIATLGGGEGELNAALKRVIEQSRGEDLEGLITMYAAQSAARFPHTCQSCGAKSETARSSVEDTTQLPGATKPSAQAGAPNTIF